MNDDALESVTKVGVGREIALSDHCPIYINLTLSKVVGAGVFGDLIMIS